MAVLLNDIAVLFNQAIFYASFWLGKTWLKQDINQSINHMEDTDRYTYTIGQPACQTTEDYFLSRYACVYMAIYQVSTRDSHMPLFSLLLFLYPFGASFLKPLYLC